METKMLRIMRHGREVFADEAPADNVIVITVDGGKPQKLDGAEVSIELRGLWSPQPEDVEPTTRKKDVAAKKPASKAPARKKSTSRKRSSASPKTTSLDT